MLKGKKIIIGITGSIAAYKIPFLVRLLVKEKAEIQAVMTPAARDFVTPLTLSTLSDKAVITEAFDRDTGEWNKHVELGNWADIMIVAPATANTIAKMANGISDNFLLNVYLSAKCPVFYAPAMDLDMFHHPSTQENIKKLKSFGNMLIPPNEGELASGLCGAGRMEEPESIVKTIASFLSKKKKLQGKKALVTAGPTYEAIDPVRFIGNHSSGIMGFRIAEDLAENGAEVVLLTGPSSQQLSDNRIKRVDVISAEDMFDECIKYFPSSDITVMAAAVADFTPEKAMKSKLKKENGLGSIRLKPTKDILKELGKLKSKKQLLIGFALETDDEIKNAINKLHNKNLDFIVLNSLKDEGAGFGKETNKITIINREEKSFVFELKSKKNVARDIVNVIMKRYDN